MKEVSGGSSTMLSYHNISLLDLYTANHQPTKVEPCQLFTKKTSQKQHSHNWNTFITFIFLFGVFFLLILFAILQMFCYFALTESRLLFPVMYLSLWNWLREANMELVHRIARWECQTVLEAHRNSRFCSMKATNETRRVLKEKKPKSEKFCRLLEFFFFGTISFLFVRLFLSHSFISFSLIFHSEFKCAQR